MIRTPRVLAAVALLTLNLHAVAAGSTASAKLTPCHVPGLDEEVRCGTYEVFENRAAHKGRKIALNIVVLLSKRTKAADDPLVFLAGGGVAPATGYALFLSGAFSTLREQRDILLVDQRGTGRSNPLECNLSTDPATPEFREDARFVAAVRQCRQQVEKTADLRYYTTPLAMDDLDDVRAWLGYPRLNLWGVSYGTTAAMVYVREHPDRVRTIALQGVIPLGAPMWLEVPRSSQQALDHVFTACADDPACHSAFPDLSKEFVALLQRLGGTPVNVKIEAQADVKIDDEILRAYVFRLLYSRSRIHDLPLLVHLAYQGDYPPLAERIALKGESGVPKGIYLSLVCSESIPQFDAAALPAAAAGTFMGPFRTGRDITACNQWVRGWLPPHFFAAVKSNVPALVMNGELDHLTPPRYGKQVAQSLPNSLHLILPRRGHNDVDPCVTGIIESFIKAATVSALDVSCLAKTDELSFAVKRDDLMK